MSNWDRYRCATLAELIVAWDPSIAILTEHDALSPRAFLMQPIARRALAGDVEAREQVGAWAADLLGMLDQMDREMTSLVDAGLSTAALAVALQDRYQLDLREAVDQARQLKKHGSMLACWAAERRSE